MNLCVTIVVLLATSVFGQIYDLTRTPETSGAEVVSAVVDILRRTCIFPDDNLYLRRVAYVESHDGLDSDTYRAGFDGGIWQVSEADFLHTKTDALLQSYRDAVKSNLFIDWSKVQWSDLRKPLYSAVAAELSAILRAGSSGIPNSVENQATLWANGGITANVYVRLVAELTLAEVYSNVVDVVFVIDSSASLAPEDFDKTKEFVTRVIEGFDIDSGAVHVALVEYSTNVYLKFGLDSGMSRQTMLGQVANVTYIPGGTNTAQALEFVYSAVFKEAVGMRRDSARIIVLVTDGRSDDKTKTVDAARVLKSSGVTIFTVGVGSLVDKAELRLVASNPTCIHMKTVSNYTDLPAINYQIQQESLKSSVILTPGSYNFTCGSALNVQVQSTTLLGTTVEVVTDEGRYAVFGTGSNAFTPSGVLYGFNDSATSILPVQLFMRDGSSVNLAFRNTSFDGCKSIFKVNVISGNGIKINSHITCIDGGIVSSCTTKDFDNSPFVKTGVPEPELSNLCTGLDRFIAPHPYKTDRYLYCLAGNMILVYCPTGLFFDILLNRCAVGVAVTTPLVTSPPTTPTTTVRATPSAEPPTIFHFTPTTRAPPKTTTTMKPVPVTAPINPPVINTNPCTVEHISLGLFIWPYPADNTKFIKCDIFPYSGTVLSCPEHKYYADDQKTCLYIEVVVDPTKSVYSGIDNPCKLHYQGDVQYYPHPTDIHKFIQCDPFGDAFVKDCDLHEVWEQAILNCIPTGFKFENGGVGK